MVLGRGVFWLCLLGMGTACADVQLEKVKAEWRKNLGAEAQAYFQKKADLAKKYAGACRREEGKAAAAGNIAGELFWETERERVEEGGSPSETLEHVPPRCAKIRKAWHEQLDPLYQAYRKALPAKLEELDDRLAELESELTGRPDALSDWRDTVWTRITMARVPGYAELMVHGKEHDYGYMVSGDLARSSREAVVEAVERAPELIDGIIRGRHNVARSPLGEPVAVKFPAKFRINRIRFRLYTWGPTDPGRWFRYRVQTSADGYNWETVINRTEEGKWQRWQDLTFPARAVKAIRIIGTEHSEGTNLAINELEAYCVEPEAGLE